MSLSPEEIRILDDAVERTTFKFDDSRIPTEIERQHLCRLMYLAFCDLRILTREGRSEQANALADALHNVPLLMHRNDFSFRALRDSLARYQQRYEGKLLTNYPAELDKLTRSAIT
jgi:hypothetical protein